MIEHPITVTSLLSELESAGKNGKGALSDKDIVDNFTLSVRRMWENCWCYNHEGTKVGATELRGYFPDDIQE